MWTLLKEGQAIAGEEVWKQSERYQRYKLTDDGISPRLVPGRCGTQVVLADSDEHTEDGHITEAADVRVAMTKKRLKRLEQLRNEVQEPWIKPWNGTRKSPSVFSTAWRNQPSVIAFRGSLIDLLLLTGFGSRAMLRSS